MKKVLWISLFGVHAALAAAPRPMTPADVARVRSVLEVSIAPDGRSVAYVVGEPRKPLDEGDGPPRQHLWVLRPEGGSPKKYVGGDIAVMKPRFLPGGDRIGFLATRPGDTGNAVYSIALDGGEATRVRGAPRAVVDYAVSADGKNVAVLVVGASENGSKGLAGYDQEVYEEMLGGTKVLVAPVDDPDAAGKELDLPGSAVTVAFSKRGELAVTVTPSPLTDDLLMRRKVLIVDPVKGGVLGTVETEGKLGEVSWSPDGARVAIIAAADISDPKEGRIRVAPRTGGPGVRLLDDFEGHVTAIAWKDSDTLAYVADVGLGSEMGLIGVDGSDHERVPMSHPISALSVAQNGRFATLGESPLHPFEVFTGKLGDDALERHTTLNPWISELALGAQEVVKHTARDGLALEGVLIRPTGPKGAPAPLILVVHGGPEANVRNGWATGYANPGHVAASRGFAVFYPNYRGSTGRGVAFSKLGQADPAGKEFDDLVDAVDHLIGTGLVDKDRVGITGGSYGGYASAWGATAQTERFAAAVMFVGISDKRAKATTTDIPDEEALVHQLGRPWEHWQRLEDRSPIRHVEKARTPILIAHGKDDPRVHPSQSLMLYRMLKEYGKVPVRLVYYPLEQHGNRRAASRLDYNLRMLQWFEHYLREGDRDKPPPDKAIDYRALLSGKGG